MRQPIKLAQAGAGWRRLAQAGAGWRRLAQAGAGWRRLAQAGWRRLGLAGAGWDWLAQASTGHPQPNPSLHGRDLLGAQTVPIEGIGTRLRGDSHWGFLSPLTV